MPARTKGFQPGPVNPAWSEQPTPSGGRQRARRRYPLGPCARCGAPGVDRHHVDGDTSNNEPSNVEVLCRSCHMAVDGRLRRLVEAAAAANRKLAEPCINCGVMTKPRRRGRCQACYRYLRRTGRERPES